MVYRCTKLSKGTLPDWTISRVSLVFLPAMSASMTERSATVVGDQRLLERI